MPQLRVLDGFQLRNDPFGQHLAKFHTPLVEGIDVPDRSLGENAVLVKSDEFAERFRREPFHQDRVCRTIAFKNPVGTNGSGVRSAFTSSSVLPKASASV